jgi:hypothetical protein
MANDLTTLIPKIIARSLPTLREAVMFPQLVLQDYDEDAAKKGDVINIPVPAAQEADDVVPAVYGSAPASKTPGNVQIALDNWKKTDFHLTDKELNLIAASETYIPMQTDEAIRALANAVDAQVAGNYTKFYDYVGTAGSTPFSAVTDFTNARKMLQKRLAPTARRYLVVDPDAEAMMLGLAQISDVDKVGERAPKIDGAVGRKFGFDIYMSNNIPTHTAGTAVSITVGSTTAASATGVDLRGSALGTLVIGDIISIAGNSQTYAVQNNVTLASAANTKVSVLPALVAIASSGKVVTKRASHVVNMAFQQQAIGLGSRPLDEMEGLGNRLMSIVDPVTGLAIRLEVERQHKQVAWTFDTLWGSGAVRNQFGTRVAG